MVDLNKTRAVFFDFEDTLAVRPVRRTPDERDRERALGEASLCAFAEDGTPTPSSFKALERSSAMSVFIDIAMSLPKETRPALFLLGLAESSAVAECERRWVLNAYSADITALCVSSPEAKVPTALATARAFGLRLEECLVIDSSAAVLKSAEDAWMRSATPLEVAEYALSYIERNGAPVSGNPQI